MVKKKRLTKRKTLLTKYKIFRKAKDKDRKLKKAAKKNPLFKSKLRKDPGVPNLWPFKQEVLEKIQQHKEQEKADKEQKKLEKKVRREQNDDEEMDDEPVTTTAKAAPSSVSQMAKLRFEAAAKEAEFESKKSLMGTENEDGVKDIKQHAISQASKRAYYREFKKVVEASDVILEILDARDPLGCRCPDIEKTILSTNPNKKIVLVLNKIDLVPREVVQKWMDYFRNEFPTIAFKSSTQKQRENISQRSDNPLTADNHSRKSSACLGANALIQLLKNYSRSADIKKNITVGIIGYPNVGKSSVINSLKRTKVVNVGAMPGLTKSLQEIHLDQNIKLLDCPGIIFSSNPQLDAEIILRNAVRIEQLDDVVSPVEQLLKRCKKERLMSLYGIPDFNGAEQFLAHVAKARGRLKAGGKPKITQAGKIVLKDWTSGKIPFFTLPPSAPQSAVEQFNAPEHDKWAHVNQSEDLMMIPSLKERMSNKEDFIPLVSSNAPNNVTVEEDLDKADYAQDLEDSDSEVEMDDDEDDDDDE